MKIEDLFSVRGKVVVITGGSKGLGRAMALGFAEAGAHIVVASRKLEPCEVVADDVRSLGRRALAVSCHVGDWAQCEQLVAATIAEFGRIEEPEPTESLGLVGPQLADEPLGTGRKLGRDRRSCAEQVGGPTGPFNPQAAGELGAFQADGMTQYLRTREPGLVGAKYGLSLLGLCAPDVRLPLVGLTDPTKARIKSAMQHAGLI